MIKLLIVFLKAVELPTLKFLFKKELEKHTIILILLTYTWWLVHFFDPDYDFFTTHIIAALLLFFTIRLKCKPGFSTFDLKDDCCFVLFIIWAEVICFVLPTFNYTYDISFFGGSGQSDVYFFGFKLT